MLNEDIAAVGALAHLPIGELFRSLAVGLADAQAKLDDSSMKVAELMSGSQVMPDGKVRDSRVFFGYHLEQEGSQIRRVPDKLSMLELGFVPNFYQFVDTIIEVKVAVSVSRTARATSGPAGGGQTAGGAAGSGTGGGNGNGRSSNGQSPYELTTTPVDASYSSSYNFQAQFSSVLKTKLVPIPPPAVLEDRIRQIAGLPRDDAAAPAETEAAELDEGKPRQVEDKGRSQVSKVEVIVGQGATRRLGLEIRLKGESQSLIPPGKTTEIETVRGSSTRTAEILAAKLNEAVPHLLVATARYRWVTLKFHDTREYEIVQDPGGGRTNRFDVKEPPTVKARAPGGK